MSSKPFIEALKKRAFVFTNPVNQPHTSAFRVHRNSELRILLWLTLEVSDFISSEVPLLDKYSHLIENRLSSKVLILDWYS